LGTWFLQVLVLIAWVFSSIPRNSFWGFCCGHISCTLCFQAEDTSKKWHLDRQEDVKEKPMVKELAKILGAKTSNWFLCNVFVHANNVEQWWWWVFLNKRYKVKMLYHQSNVIQVLVCILLQQCREYLSGKCII